MVFFYSGHRTRETNGTKIKRPLKLFDLFKDSTHTDMTRADKNEQNISYFNIYLIHNNEVIFDWKIQQSQHSSKMEKKISQFEI